MRRHRSLLVSVTLALACAAAPLPAFAQKGLSFDGTSQYVTFGVAPSLGSPTFTLECWFKREGPGVGTNTGDGGISEAIPLIAKGRAEADADSLDMNYFLGIRAGDGVLVADFEEGTGQPSPSLNHPITGFTSVGTDSWHHAAATFDGTHWRLYLDGAIENEIDMASPIFPQSASFQHASLASALNSQGIAAGYFQGAIDEARIWNYARDGQAIADSLGLEIESAPGLIGRWALDKVTADETPTTVLDAPVGLVMGDAKPGPGAPFVITPPPPPTPPTPSSLRFDGARQYVTFGVAPSLGAATFTLECWFRREGPGVATTTGPLGIAPAIPLIAKGRAEDDGDARDMNYFLGIRASDGVLVADFEEGSGQPSPGKNHPIAGITPVETGLWRHAAATFDGTHWRLFLDGTLESEIVLPSPIAPQSASIQHASLATALNSSGVPAGFFQGTIDEARIWDHAREGQAIMDSLALEIPSAPGLVGRWALDAINANVTPTTATGGVKGTVVGGATLGPSSPFAVSHPPSVAMVDSPPDKAAQVSDSPSLSVTADDADGGDLAVTFYGRPVPVPARPDFTIIGMSDTQCYTASLNGATPALFDAQTAWIVNQHAARNIAAVIHAGDCVQNGDNNGDPAEWLVADHAMRALEDPAMTLLANGIPYGICVGNHDQSPDGDPHGTTTFYNQYFGSARFEGRPYYGGHFGDNNNNHFELFSASGMDFIIVSLEYDPSPGPAVLGWADSLLTVYADRRAIVTSHYLIDPAGPGEPGTFGTQGQAIYDALKGHANLFLMMCGHRQAEARRSDTYQGHTVTTLLADYENRTDGGDGWLRIYEFSPANNVIRVRTYSPVLGRFEADPDSSSQFTLPYDMGGPAFQTLGTATVASGSIASVTWPNLTPGTAYEWYAAVNDGARATPSPTWRFTTDSGLPLAVGDAPGANFWARVAPSPIRHDGVLDFATPRAGFARVDLFDASGRRVRRLMDAPSLPPGRHQLGIDAHSAGDALRSGLYFYRIETVLGSLHGRFVVTR